MKAPKLLEILLAGAPGGWRFGAASFLRFETVRLEKSPWTLTRSLHVANGFRTSWDLHPREEIDVETRDRLVSGAFHTLFHAFERAGYDARVLDAPPVLSLGFHRPQKTADEAAGEFAMLAQEAPGRILEAGRLASVGRRKAREHAYVAPEACAAAVETLVREKALQEAVFTLNALLERPLDGGWFLLAHATNARGRTTVGAVLTRDPGAAEGRELEALPPKLRRSVEKAFAAGGFARNDDGWFARTATATALPRAMAWLSDAALVVA